MFKTIKKHLIFLSVFILYYVLLYILDTTCLIKKVFGIYCPTCGATRSLLALTRLDFKSYWYYHPASLLIVLALFLALHRKNILKKMNNILYNILRSEERRVGKECRSRR